jgi:integrase
MAHFYAEARGRSFATGMRPSELCGLRWGDVDLKHATLDVRRSRTMHEDCAPKTTASERVVRMPAIVVAVLRDAMPLHVDPEAFVFRQPSGKPVHGESFQKHEWQRGLGALRGKVKARKFYACRHTCASILLTKGTPAKFVAEQLGTSLAMLQAHYGKFMGGDAAQLDAALGLPAITVVRKAS